MKSIGGYFELELEKGEFSYHKSAVAMKSGRSSLLYILEYLKPSLVYVPYYTSDGLLDPLFQTNITFKFYSINHQLEPDNVPTLRDGEYFIYINYFDLKRKYVSELSDLLKDKLIVDCSQAFFLKGNGKSWFYNSCRSFFGTPDGSYLYAPSVHSITERFPQNENFTVDHLVARFNGHAESGYSSFQKNESLCAAELSLMSKLTEYLMSRVDYNHIIEKRRSNFFYLHSVFSEQAFFDCEIDDECVPMAFPALWHKSINRRVLTSKKVFIPTFWNDVLKRDCHGFDAEKRFSVRILPLPIDHRYDILDMIRMETILKLIK